MKKALQPLRCYFCRKAAWVALKLKTDLRKIARVKDPVVYLKSPV